MDCHLFFGLHYNVINDGDVLCVLLDALAGGNTSSIFLNDGA